MIRTILSAALILLSLPTQAETPTEWIALGTRAYGGFGAFIPIGIRIGLDAKERIQAEPRRLTVTYYTGEKAPCPCIESVIALPLQNAQLENLEGTTMSTACSNLPAGSCAPWQLPLDRRAGSLATTPR